MLLVDDILTTGGSLLAMIPAVEEAGGEIVGERCLPIADREVDQLVAAVAAARPSFILSNLLGPSSHAFLRAMRDLAERDPGSHGEGQGARFYNDLALRTPDDQPYPMP